MIYIREVKTKNAQLLLETKNSYRFENTRLVLGHAVVSHLPKPLSKEMECTTNKKQ